MVRLAAAETAIVLEPDTLRPVAVTDIGKAADLRNTALWQPVLRRLADWVAQKGTSEQKAETAQHLEILIPEADGFVFAP